MHEKEKIQEHLNQLEKEEENIIKRAPSNGGWMNILPSIDNNTSLSAREHEDVEKSYI